MTPTARLVALTNEARHALGGRADVWMDRFPFRFGRESRSSPSDTSHHVELRLGTAPEVNDLYLIEPPWTDLFEISREHFAIAYEHGQFWLVDRGSACGTIVAGTQVGGRRAGGRAALREIDTIVVGNADSPYSFRFEAVSGAVSA